MNKQQILDEIIKCGIAAIVRGQSAEKILKAIEAALEGGVVVIEITFTVPNALEIIKHLSANIGDDVILGAGTVLTPEMAEDAIQAGAQFIVSPCTNLEVIDKAKSLGAPVFPGALPPTEVVTAWQAEADMVKIFPANVMGPTYLKDLRGPLPEVKFIPTGGVTLDTAKAYLENGASALGVGSDLINKQLMDEGNFTEIKERAQRFMQIVKQFRD